MKERSPQEMKYLFSYSYTDLNSGISGFGHDFVIIHDNLTQESIEEYVKEASTMHGRLWDISVLNIFPLNR